jgi:Gpi18-like mannosyltransferase
MCSLSVILTFVLAHIVAWSALGGGWSGAGRAPFAVFFPALALLVLNAVWTDSYTDLGLKIGTLASWEMLYFFLYVCLRIALRPTVRQALPRR